MGNDYKTFLGVPGSFFLHGWQCFFCSWAVPGGLWGHESGHVYDAPNIIFKPYRALPLYPRTEPHCRLPCQTSAKNIRLNSIATCAIMVQTLWMLPCMSRRAAPTLNATGPKKEASFCKKPCLASMDPLSVCVCMPALVVAVLMAYDYECARKLSASLFLGSQKQAFLASWLWALIVYKNMNIYIYMYIYISIHMILYVFTLYHVVWGPPPTWLVI